MDGTTFETLDQSQLIIVLVFYAVLGVFFIAAYVTIIRKAGFSGWWILTIFIPVVNLIMIAVFAFSEWPVHRQLKASRYALQQHGTAGQAYSRFSWGG